MFSGNKYAGGNPVCPRPTPEWQKGIASKCTWACSLCNAQLPYASLQMSVASSVLTFIYQSVIFNIYHQTGFMMKDPKKKDKENTKPEDSEEAGSSSSKGASSSAACEEVMEIDDEPQGSSSGSSSAGTAR